MKMKPINIKIFLLALVAQFLMTFLLTADIKPLEFLSFLKVKPLTLVSPKDETLVVFDTIKYKLDKPDTYSFNLSKPSSVISTAIASENQEYDEASSYIVADLTSGKVLASKNQEKRLPIASITKLMTAVVTLDLASPTTEIIITENAAAQIPTKIGVVAGQSMTVNELLHALMLTSANDSAEALLDGINNLYKEDVFIKAMNEKAKILGLKNSHFDNPQGFDGDNYSSVEDLALLTHYALQNYPLLKEIVAKDYHYLAKSEKHKQFDLYNWNGLLGVYPGASGLKIGNTDDAGKTTIVTASRDGHQLVAIVLGAPGVLERDMWASQLLDAGFTSEYKLKPINVSEEQFKEKYASWKYW